VRIGITGFSGEVPQHCHPFVDINDCGYTQTPIPIFSLKRTVL
jgi:hypothetical protein